jgi:alpha-beta hydrolase superfamily lysophospholipase
VSILKRYRDHYRLNRLLTVQEHTRHSIALIDSGAFELVAQCFTPPQPRGTVLVFHGYYDHLGLYGDLVALCLQAGWSVLGIDLPGHGLSSGEPASIDSFCRYDEAWLDLLASLETQRSQGMLGSLELPVCALGQSTGAAVIMDLLLHHDFAQRVPLSGYLLLAPLLRPHRWSQIGWLLPLLRPFVKSLRRGFSRNSHDARFVEFLERQDGLQCRRLPVAWVGAMADYMRRFETASPSAVALTLWQGTADLTVDWRFNLPAIAQKFPNSQINRIEGARHHLVNESPPYRDALFRDIAGQLDRLASQARPVG